MEGSAFSPGNLQVPVGATVTFTNYDAATHNANGGGAFETENLKRDERDTVTFAEPGTYAYKCSLHPSMKARSTVVEAGVTPSPTQ